MKELNVKFEDVEIIGSSDNLLEDTNVTKVIMRGDNTLSSLDSTFKNCSSLSVIDGGINLKDVDSANNILENTPMLTDIEIHNPTNPNLSCINGFPNIKNMIIDGEYTKGGIQGVLGGTAWDFEGYNYGSGIVENITLDSQEVSGLNQLVLTDTLEPKARGFELEGETYDNLIVGQTEVTVTEEYSFTTSGDSNVTFACDKDRNVSIEEIQGETYQNLISDGQTEFTLTATPKQYTPLGLLPSKQYTLELDSIGANSNNITVNLGGTTTTLTTTNGTKVRHKVSVTTPATLINNLLEFSGEGVKVSNVMLFQDVVSQNPSYVDGIQSIGVDNGDGTYKIEILSNSHSDNLFMVTDEFKNLNEWTYWKYFNIYIPMKYGQKIGHKFFTDSKGLSIGWSEYDSKFNFLSKPNENITDVYNSNCSYFRLKIFRYNSTWTLSELYGIMSFLYVSRGTIDSNVVFDVRKEDKKQILLPQPLRKIGSVCDRLYWDIDKGHYCIEKKIGYASTSHILQYYDVVAAPNENRSISKVGVFTSLGDSVPTYNKNPNLYQSKNIFTSVSIYSSDYYYLNHNETNLLANGYTETAQSIKQAITDVGLAFAYIMYTPQIIDLPTMNTKLNINLYAPTNYLSTSNTQIQPNSIKLAKDLIKYLPYKSLQTNLQHTLQFNCTQLGTQPLKMNLGDTIKSITPTLGINKVNITSPATITNNRLYLSGEGNKVKEVMLFGDTTIQSPSYFNGIQTVGVPFVDNGVTKYKVDIVSSTHSNGGQNPNLELWGVSNYLTSYAVTQSTGLTIEVGVNSNTDQIMIQNESYGFKLYTEGNILKFTNFSTDAGFETFTLGVFPNNTVVSIVIQNNKIQVYNNNVLKVSNRPLYLTTQKINVVGTVEYLRITEGIVSNLLTSIPMKPQTTTIVLNEPLKKIGSVADRLYWDKALKKYMLEKKIDSNGNILTNYIISECVVTNTNNLPRLHQKQNTNINISTGILNPSKTKIEYNNIK